MTCVLASSHSAPWIFASTQVIGEQKIYAAIDPIVGSRLKNRAKCHDRIALLSSLSVGKNQKHSLRYADAIRGLTARFASQTGGAKTEQLTKR